MPLISDCNISPITVPGLSGLYKRLVQAFKAACTFVQKLAFLFKNCFRAETDADFIAIFASET